MEGIDASCWLTAANLLCVQDVEARLYLSSERCVAATSLGAAVGLFRLHDHASHMGRVTWR
jgi:hypothetical protein